MILTPQARATRALIALLLLAQQPLTMTLATPSVSSGVQFPSAVEWISPSAGVLAEALEVSSGNATFALEGLGESNQRSVLTDSSGSIGGSGWNLRNLVRLKGFDPAWDKVTTPNLAFVSFGGTQGTFFERLYEPSFDAEPLLSAPSWVQRYAPVAEKVAVFREQVNPRVPPTGAWLVVVLRDQKLGGAVAHYFNRDGERITFAGGSGEFADSQQNPYQQVSSVKRGDLYGTDSGSPRTAYTYAAPGLLSSVSDEWGRRNSYEWDVATKRLNAANLLLRDPADPNSWTRRVEFEYQRIGAAYYLSALRSRFSDGALGEHSARWQFAYATMDQTVLVERVSQQIGAGWVSNLYSYADATRLSSVRRVAGLTAQDAAVEPDVVYTAAGNSDFRGQKLTVTQGEGDSRRERIYHLDGAGLLRRELVWDSNPYVAGSESLRAAGNLSASRWLKTDYTYTPNGQLASRTDPSGARLVYRYDGRGNRIAEERWLSGALYRSRLWRYDSSNRIVSESKPALSGTGYAIPEVERTLAVRSELRSEVVTPLVEGAKLEFSAPATLERETLVGGVRSIIITERLDERGRLEERSERGGDLERSERFEYGSGAALALPAPDERGASVSGISQPQFGDQVASSTVTGTGLAPQTTRYRRDALGRSVLETQVAGLVLGFDSAGNERRADRVVSRSFDGDGRLVWQQIAVLDGATLNVANTERWVYNASGGLELSWTGAATNLTVYEREASGANLGRATVIRRGLGNSSGQTLTQTRETRQLDYDAFGRLAGETVAPNPRRAISYDTLDRVTSETSSLGLVSGYAYAPNGARTAVEQRGDANTPASLELSTFDALGRQTAVERSSGNGATVKVSTVFDPWDNPLRTTDDRLTMNRAGEDRTAYRVFDGLGRLAKELSAANASAGAAPDARRAYSEFRYDAFGRRTEQRVLLEGLVTPDALSSDATSNLPGGAAVAVTQYRFDAMNRVIGETDPEGYRRAYAYDALGNRILSVRQLCRSDRSTLGCSSAVEGLATVAGEQLAVAERFAFDAAGRQVVRVDASGQTERLAYSPFGDLTSRTDRRGVVTELREYSGDGLLERVLAPDDAPGTPADGTRSGYQALQTLEYGASRFPQRVCNALNDRAASVGTCTDLTTDAGGNVTRERSGSLDLVTRRFDARGFLLETRDADGFETRYTRDASGRELSRLQPARGGEAGATDLEAGLRDGLLRRSSYDAAGNLERLLESSGAPDAGIVFETLYSNDRAGQRVGESRRRALDRAVPVTRQIVRRLDGAVVARTDYAFVGEVAALRTSGSTRAPSFSSGAVRRYTLDKNGQTLEETLFGAVTPFSEASGTATATKAAPSVQQRLGYTRTGTGWITARVQLEGNSEVYGEAVAGSATTEQTWRYDARGLPLEHVSREPGLEREVQSTYAYSASGRETSRSQRVTFSTGRELESRVATTYTERDAPLSATVTERTALTKGANNQRTATTNYTYGIDGQVVSVETDKGRVEYERDERGRLTSVRDSNGGSALGIGGATAQIKGPVRIAISYPVSGTQRRTVFDASNTCIYQDDISRTVGERNASSAEWSGGSACGVGTTTKTLKQRYAPDGRPLESRLEFAPVTVETPAVRATATVSRVSALGYDALEQPVLSSQTFETRIEGQRYGATGQRCAGPVEVVFANTGTQPASQSYLAASDCTTRQNVAIAPGKRVTVSAYRLEAVLGWKDERSSATRTTRVARRFDANGATLEETRLSAQDAPPLTLAASSLPLQATAGDGATRYRLDAEGRRLEVRGGPQQGLKLRYDSIGQIAQLDWRTITGRATPTLTELLSDSSGAVIAAVRVDARQRGRVGWQLEHRTERQALALHSFEFDGRERWRDATYTLADGILETDAGQWLPSSAIAGQVFPLDAPQQALSARLGIDPLAIEAPGNVPSSRPGDPTQITPPGTGNSVSTLSTPALGSSLVGTGTGLVGTGQPTATSSTSPLNAPTTPVTAPVTTTGSVAALQAPGNALPPGAVGLGMTQLESPSAAALPNVRPDPSAIGRPDGIGTPPSPTNPNSTNGGILPPSGQTPGSALPPGVTAGPSTLETLPPAGWDSNPVGARVLGLTSDTASVAGDDDSLKAYLERQRLSLATAIGTRLTGPDGP